MQQLIVIEMEGNCRWRRVEMENITRLTILIHCNGVWSKLEDAVLFCNVPFFFSFQQTAFNSQDHFYNKNSSKALHGF